MKKTDRDESTEIKFESFLSEFRRKPAPAGLKERILHRLAELRQRRHLETAFTPSMRLIAVFCLVFIVLTLSAELIITRSETRSIQALWPPAASDSVQPVEDEFNSIWAEWLGLSTYEKSLFSLWSAGKKTFYRSQISGAFWQIKIWQIKILMEELNGT
jgi:hypothetical protein